MDIKILKELIAILEKSELKKLGIKKGDFEVHLEKQDSSSSIAAPHVVVPSIYLEKPSSEKTKEEGVFVLSPMVGTFYSSPSPGQPPFVKKGDKVTENTIVCIIEAMKVMNEVKASVKGTVEEVLVDNADTVEFGTKLFRIV